MQKLTGFLLNWFAHNARDLPWRSREAGRDPYAIWVSEIMLQQTQVKTVIPFWERWMRELPTIQAAAGASPAKIHKLWEGLGYYTRVRNLQKAAQFIVAKHGGIFPEDFDGVLALPGVGRYTAGAICSIAFNQATPILDGNVIRVLTRIFGIRENPKEKKTNARLWHLAGELVSHAKELRWGETPGEPAREDARPIKNRSCSHLNQSLMELGALVCTPRNPQCGICPMKKLCVAFRDGRVEELPNLGKRETVTARRFVAFIVESNGRFLVRQRPAGVVNAHLWEFPNVEIGARVSRPAAPLNTVGRRNLSKDFLKSQVLRLGEPRSESVSDAAIQIFGIAPVRIEPLSTVKHSITRYRITLEGYRVQLRKQPRPQTGVWKSPAQIQRVAFTAAHKKLASLAADCILSGR